MSQQLHLELSDELMWHIRKAADASARSVEAVAVESLGLLFGGSAVIADVAYMDVYTDQQLWAVVHQRLAMDDDQRMQALIETGKQGDLADSDQAELDALLEKLDDFILLRSNALLLLKQRGHPIEAYLDTED
jgi:hypothetical protein